MDLQISLHVRVPKAAELRARNLVISGLGDLEPDRDLAAWDGVLLQPGIRKEKAVDDILRHERDQDRVIDRHMKEVLLAVVVSSSELSVESGVRHEPVELA